jgi:hypothetical protein
MGTLYDFLGILSLRSLQMTPLVISHVRVFNHLSHGGCGPHGHDQDWAHEFDPR